MTRIFIIRHAEADGNLYRRVHGQYDGLVTPNGLLQIEALGKRFEGERLDAVYASDLYRARKTAAALYLPRGLAPRCTPRLREINLGVWEDLTWGEASVRYPEEFETFTDRPWRFSIRDGESMAELSDRVCGAVCDIAAQNSGKTVAVVCHGMAIRALMCRFEGLYPEELGKIRHCDNTAVALVEFDGQNRPLVVFRNDSSHLSEEISTFARQKWWRGPEGADAGGKAAQDVNLIFRPVDMEKEKDIVEASRRDAWKTIHGSLKYYNAAQNLRQAARMAKADPRAVVFAESGGEIAGLLQLDEEDRGEPDTGHVSFVYLKEDYRGMHLGIQLIGHAVSVYRKLGRRRLRLRVSENNGRALSFYKKAGFYQTDYERGPTGALLVLHKDIFPDL